MRRHRIAFAAAALMVAASVPVSAGTQRITENDFGEAWPFTVPEGILSCTGASAVVFTTRGVAYAVNGMADSAGFADIEPIWKHNWKMYRDIAKALKITPEEAKAQIGPVRVNIGPIIDAGLALCG